MKLHCYCKHSVLCIGSDWVTYSHTWKSSILTSWNKCSIGSNTIPLFLCKWVGCARLVDSVVFVVLCLFPFKSVQLALMLSIPSSSYGQTGTGKTFTMEGERSLDGSLSWEEVRISYTCYCTCNSLSSPCNHSVLCIVCSKCKHSDTHNVTYNVYTSIVCLILLSSFFLPSASLVNMYTRLYTGPSGWRRSTVTARTL